MKNNEKIQRVFDKDRDRFYFQKPILFRKAISKYFREQGKEYLERDSAIFEYMCTLHGYVASTKGNNEFYMPIIAASKDLGCGPDTIKKAIKDLQELDLIKVTSYVTSDKYVNKTPKSAIRNFYSVNMELIHRLLEGCAKDKINAKKFMDINGVGLYPKRKQRRTF